MSEAQRAAEQLLAGEGFDPKIEWALGRALSALDEVLDLPFNSVRRRLHAARECFAILEQAVPTGNIDSEELRHLEQLTRDLFRGDPLVALPKTPIATQLTDFLEERSLTSQSPLNQIFRIGTLLCCRYCDHPTLCALANRYTNHLRSCRHFIEATALYAEVADCRIEAATGLPTEWRFGDREKCVDSLLKLIDEETVVDTVRSQQESGAIPPFPADYKAIARNERPDPVAFYLEHYARFALYRYQLKELEPVLHDAVVNKMTAIQRTGKSYRYLTREIWSLSELLPQKKARLDLIRRLIPESVRRSLEGRLISLRLRDK